MSQDIGNTRTHVWWVRVFVIWGVCGFAGGLVVEGEFAEEFAGGGVDDADVEVWDEERDVGSGVGSSDADVVEAAVDSEGDDAGVVDLVAA